MVYKNNPTKILLPTLEELEEISYCIACFDQESGYIGIFAYDEDLYKWGCGHFAISPVFHDIESFYVWAKSNGFKYHKLGSMFTMSKTFPGRLEDPRQQ